MTTRVAPTPIPIAAPVGRLLLLDICVAVCVDVAGFVVEVAGFAIEVAEFAIETTVGDDTLEEALVFVSTVAEVEAAA